MIRRPPRPAVPVHPPVRSPAVLAALLVLALGQGAGAGEYHVPAPYATLQAALDAAAAGGDALETVLLDADVDLDAAAVIPQGFGAAHALVVRPGAGRDRARLRMLSGIEPAIVASAASHVTLQDLDVVRHAFNEEFLVVYENCSEMVIERCRIGSDWPEAGIPNCSTVYWSFPLNGTIRNTIVFAAAPGTWQTAIVVVHHDTPGSRLRVYHNTVEGFYASGINLKGTAGEVYLRNNVVVTAPAIAPDPVGYSADIGPGLSLHASHNAVFADAGDEWGGPDDIRGSSFARLDFIDLAASFVSTEWIENDANAGYLSLQGGGPLHTPSRFGVALPGGAPDAGDGQVFDDWERQSRPGGAPAHTDRGADQSDADGPALAAPDAAPRVALFVEASPNPARGSVEIRVRAAHEGPVALRLVDVSGRVLRAGALAPGARGEARRTAWDLPGLPSGVYFVVAETPTGRASAKVALLD